MASHPEQLRYQLIEAISSSIPYDHPDIEDIDIELVDVIQGKGSSHYIAIFYFSKTEFFAALEMQKFLQDARYEILDAVAMSITRKRIPNITFRVTDVYPEIPTELI
jgi:hypothetical protein